MADGKKTLLLYKDMPTPSKITCTLFFKNVMKILTVLMNK